jgi:mannosyltransferase
MDWLYEHTPLLYVTQSLWRDEAFSVLAAEHSFADIISITKNDFTPPLYYFLLKIWMIVFGRSEIAVRLLSFIFHVGTVYVSYRLVKDVIKNADIRMPWIVSFLMFINPMLLYYAFEARTYSLVVFLVSLSHYFLLKRSWVGYGAAVILSLYAHPYTALVFLSQGLYICFKQKKLLMPLMKTGAVVFLLYTPWISSILLQISKSGEMWYYPVTPIHLAALLGSIYLGYEGTPGYLWSACIVLSVVIAFFVWRGAKTKFSLFYGIQLLSLFLPLVVVMAISLVKPIYTQRYVIFTAFSEVMLLCGGLYSFSSQLRNILAIVTIMGTIGFSVWYPSQHAKTDFHRSFTEINAQFMPGDIVVNESALTFFESTYYASDPSVVYLYNPSETSPPHYIGTVLIPETSWIARFPEKVSRGNNVFFLHEDGSYDILDPYQ